jgi:hypothetical protein
MYIIMYLRARVPGSRLHRCRVVAETDVAWVCVAGARVIEFPKCAWERVVWEEM